MTAPISSFSDRFGYRDPDAPITIREDAPVPVREGIIMAGYAVGVAPGEMRSYLCESILKAPNINANWSDDAIRQEVMRLIKEIAWYQVYNFVEHLYKELDMRSFISESPHTKFAAYVNQFFREKGVGWELKGGILVARGSEAFALATENAPSIMRKHHAPSAAHEIHEALKDISNRPHADVTGAIQHAMAGLECVARKVGGSSDTLGKLIKQLGLPRPLDEAVSKLWGFASENGRHLLEEKHPQFKDAELLVTTACALSVYLLRASADTDRTPAPQAATSFGAKARK